ncbi:hypothetical protein ACFOWA_09555 [Pedobacter lithocola]|uniref:Lipoprotein n=1 Tax=Pedobacter lithocola TaxID=1908239 RepID=A0ABV8PBS2_9SPHI
MKGIVLFIGVIGLCAATLFYCNTEKNSKLVVSKPSPTQTNSPTNLIKPTIKIIKLKDVPSFSSDEVNQGLAEYINLKYKYLEALKTKDTSALKSLSNKYLKWVKGANIWSEKLKPYEIQKYADYVLKLNKEWTFIAQEAIK